MPNIRSFASVEGLNIPDAFPAAGSPAYTHTDFPADTNPVNWGENGGFMTLSASEMVMPGIFRVPHNQNTGVATSSKVKSFPSVSWTVLKGQSQFRYAYAHPALNLEIGVESFNDTTSSGTGAGEASARCLLNCQGFTFSYRRSTDADVTERGGEPIDGPDNPDEDEDQNGWELRWLVGSGENARGYALSLDGGGQVLVSYWDPTTNEYSAIKPADSSGDVGRTLYGTYATSGDYSVIEVILAGGKMYVTTGAGDNPVLLDESRVDSHGNAIQRVSRVEVSTYDHKTMYWSVNPLKFYAKSSYDSVSIPIGFKASDKPSCRAIPAGGWSDLGDVSVQVGPTDDNDSLLGPTVQYRLNMKLPITGSYKGTQYADFAPGVHAVHLHWARGFFLRTPTQPLSLYPEVVSVSQVFNPNSLTTRSSASLQFNNNKGEWGQWSQESGIIASAISLTRTAILGGEYAGVPDFVRVFTGFAHTNGETVLDAGGASQFIMRCEDRVRQLMAPVWALPWMDGWNSVYAIAFLAQLGGVPIEDMVFANFVPDDPYDDWGDPSYYGGFNPGAYFLPVGHFSTALTRFSGEPLWTIMQKIAYSIGYQLYFDAFGRLHFEKFLLPFFTGQLGVKRTFFEDDLNSDGAEGCTSLISTKDLSTVRNRAVVVGTNSFSPIWEPIVMTASDTGSMLDPTSPNYIGMLQPVVWADSQFADPSYAWKACLNLLGFLRLPERKVTFETWYQPDIYPLDLVGVASRRAGLVGISFMVTSVSHRLSSGDQRGVTRITATAMSPLGNLTDEAGFRVS